MVPSQGGFRTVMSARAVSTVTNMPFIRSDLALWGRTRGRVIAILLVAAAVFGAVGVVLWGPEEVGELTLARLTEGNSFVGRLLPVAWVLATVVSAASGARRRRSFDALVVMLLGPLRGPGLAGVGTAVIWIAVQATAMALAAISLVCGAAVSGLRPLESVPEWSSLSRAALGIVFVAASSAVAWLFGWFSRLGPFGAATVVIGVGLLLSSMVVTMLSGAEVIDSSIAVLGGTLDFAIRGGPAGTALSGTPPSWFQGSLAGGAVTGEMAVVAAMFVAALVDRVVIPSPYEPS